VPVSVLEIVSVNEEKDDNPDFIDVPEYLPEYLNESEAKDE